MVFYRKYRPQKISELDSEEIRQKLYSTFSDQSFVPHAFLFTGPKGLGKTSAARIVAKVINCEENSKLKSQSSKPQRKAQNLKNEETKQVQSSEEIEPCNECSQCLSITNGTNLDILEIDGASNRGIDEIRDLREKIRLAPVSAFKKIYIIDEVHMLTTEAFNALLKTLEEPPPHVLFILCTTEPHKIPATISDRCFHIQFKLATTEELLSSFKRISKEEKLNVNNEALEYIANMSDGSFRDGAKILEEVVILSQSTGGKITKEAVEEKYQISNIKYQISKFLDYLEKRDTRGALKLISELVGQGVDMKFFIEKLVGELHSVLLRKVGVIHDGAEVANKIFLGSEQDETQSVHKVIDPSRPSENFISSQRLSVQELKTLIELFTKASGELKYAVLPQLPLELAVIGWGQKEEESARGSIKSDKGAEVANKIFLGSEQDETQSVHKVIDPSRPSENFISSQRLSLQNDIWQELISKVKTHNHSLAGVLRSCSLGSNDDKNFIIEAKYKFHKDKLSEKKAMDVLEKTVNEITGKSAKIEVVLKER